MEQMIQKYIKLFYTTIIVCIGVQLVDIIIQAIHWDVHFWTIITLVLSVINIILLTCNLKHNERQQFIECKEKLKVLKVTLPLLILIQTVVCFGMYHSWVLLGHHLMTIMVTGIVISYRIKSIEHLEKKASSYAKEKEGR